MNKEFFRIIEKNKGLVFILIVLSVLFISGIIVTVRFYKQEELSEERFPESTLSQESLVEPSYHVPNFKGSTLGCPNIPYDVEVPGEIARSYSTKVVTEYDGLYYTLYESDQELFSALNDRFSNYFMQSIDIPESNFESAITDTGYINGYKAEYQTGILRIITKIKSYTYYAAAYAVDVGEDSDILLLVTSESVEKLHEGKLLLDEVVLTIVSNRVQESSSEDIEEEIIPETTVLETVETEVTDDGERVIVEGGITYFAKEWSVGATEEYEGGMYIVFKWVNALVQPIEMYVISPSGDKYERERELSEDGEWVFIIPENEIGTYTIYGETTGTIYVNYYEALNKRNYYAVYRNLDIDTGEPVRGFGE